MRSFRWSAAIGLVFVASFATADMARAQMPLHIAAGPTIGTISSDDFADSDASVGFFAAVGTSFPVGETVAVSPWLGYVQKGAEFGDETASYDYIEIPVLIQTWFPVGENMNWMIFAGPQFGFQINCDEDGFDCTEFANHKGTEFGAMIGTGLQFGGGFSVGVGADVGFTDLFDDLDYKTRTFFLSVGYTAWLGGARPDGM